MANPLSEKVHDVLLNWAQEMSDRMRESLTKHGHVDYSGSGDLYQAATISPEWITDEEGDAFRIRIVLPFYAQYLNDGTRPSRKNPSPDFINKLSGGVSWISRKGIPVSTVRSWTDEKGKQRKTTFKNKADANKSFAWAIAKNRLKYGSQGSHWFDEVWGGDPVPENSEAMNDLREALQRIAGNAQFFIDIVDPNKPDKI